MSRSFPFPANFVSIFFGYNGTLGACPAVFPGTENVIVNNAVVSYNTQVGIGLQCNTAQSTTIMHNVSDFNGVFDGYDGNAACASNFWVVDNFTPTSRTNQPCVM